DRSRHTERPSRRPPDRLPLVPSGQIPEVPSPQRGNSSLESRRPQPPVRTRKESPDLRKARSASSRDHTGHVRLSASYICTPHPIFYGWSHGTPPSACSVRSPPYIR